MMNVAHNAPTPAPIKLTLIRRPMITGLLASYPKYLPIISVGIVEM